MKEIQSKKDIELIVHTFYKKALRDEKIGFIFTEIAQLNVAKHLPIIVNFWESIILGENNYQGNPMLKHLELNKKVNLTKEHFDQWLFLWKETIEENFEGENAQEMIQRAINISNLMQHKINQQ